MKCLFLLLMVSSLAGAQTPAKDSAAINADSVATVRVLDEVYKTMMDKNIGVKDFLMIQQVFNEYMRTKQIFWRSKPKK